MSQRTIRLESAGGGNAAVQKAVDELAAEGAGIAIGERDTDHVIRDNSVEHNAGPAVLFREPRRRGGNRVLLEGNRFAGSPEGPGEALVSIPSGVRDVALCGNEFTCPAGTAVPRASHLTAFPPTSPGPSSNSTALPPTCRANGPGSEVRISTTSTRKTTAWPSHGVAKAPTFSGRWIWARATPRPSCSMGASI